MSRTRGSKNKTAVPEELKLALEQRITLLADLLLDVIVEEGADNAATNS